ncbi:MAG: hypothetical protein ACOC80_04980 [Petrotogales bacterium]
MRDLEKEIKEADEEIEKLRILKQKKEELKQLKSELGIKDKKPLFSLSSRSKKIVSIGIALTFFISIFLVFTPSIFASSPTVAYSSISDEETFVDVVPGEGTNLTVNLSDADNDLNSVVISSNSSGTWAYFYDSSDLGGVSFHNVTVQNSNWTGSWETYYYNITTTDTSSGTNYFVYSFTTEYVFGSPVMQVYDEFNSINNGIFFKNDTGEYYLWHDRSELDVRTSTLGTDFNLKTDTDLYDIYSAGYPSAAFEYTNYPHVYFCFDEYLNAAYFDGSWHKTSVGIRQRDGAGRGHGADVKYFDGSWQIIAGRGGESYSDGKTYLSHYESSTPISSGSLINTFEYWDFPDHTTTNGYWYPDVEIYKSNLHLIYHDSIIWDGSQRRSDDVKWTTWDGINWVYNGKIAYDITRGGATMIKDRNNDQLVTFYVKDNVLYYTAYNGTSWSDAYSVFSPSSGSIQYPRASFIDSRIVINFGWNIHGNYNLYSISAPDYSQPVSGLTETYNRIDFPDAEPNQQHVNSTVVVYKNIDSRDIENTTWHFENIGDISVANNLRVWSNMSGSWTDSWLVGASNETSEIDISAVKGSDWQPGEKIFWKFEILDVGDVAESIHTTDEDIYLTVDVKNHD